MLHKPIQSVVNQLSRDKLIIQALGNTIRKMYSMDLKLLGDLVCKRRVWTLVGDINKYQDLDSIQVPRLRLRVRNSGNFYASILLQYWLEILTEFWNFIFISKISFGSSGRSKLMSSISPGPGSYQAQTKVGK